ncbi:kelch repeat and BTB domain-containing protein 8-like [Branchiostoma lanceolatum]|uniref:kelch repeat and BTB domain-containing protein 8-like n=1 Tax=Branchiostoma lanceolatum TaxID=7740 RepID=UPI003456B342
MAMNVERSTCVDLYQFADVFSLDNVQKTCLQWICRNFAEVASSEDFCSLSLNQLTEIISHDELEVKEETTVWEAVVRWVQHSREDRLHHLPSILPHIRFNLLTSAAGDLAAILEHPLVREDPWNSEVIRNVVQKGNSNLKPRLGMTTEMALLSNSRLGSNDLFLMNPLKGKYISCNYDPEDLPPFSAMTVTNDNSIYILLTNELEKKNQLSLFKYNHARNVWEHADISPIPKGPEYDQNYFEEHYLFEVDQILYYMAFDPDDNRPLLQMRKYNWHTDQWQECSQLQLDSSISYSVALSCGSHLCFLTSTEVHLYDPIQDRWCERSLSSQLYFEVCTAVAMGTKIFCTDFNFSQTMVYDTESDHWQKLQGWSNPENLDIEVLPSLFVLENQLHMYLVCNDDQNEEICLVYVYYRSADAWRDIKATLPDKSYVGYASHCPVARIYLPYLKEA